jgi:hypothetical protein
MTSDEWFDKHIIVDFGDFNNKEDKRKADELKQRLKEKMIIYTHMLEGELEDDETS